MKVGRPEEYDAESVAKAVKKYVSDCKAKNFLPTIEGLAVHLGKHRSTLYEWSNPNGDFYHEEFSDILEQLKAAQASQLIQNGLIGHYNATLTKLMLTKHGYRDEAMTEVRVPKPLDDVSEDNSVPEDKAATEEN